ncbi:transmembrane protein 249 isoform X1 [Choloepus didactylus]|uniref:transmembrane protein 249 isoform X1 n=1 Tax=Choloepus didactylus TaxID=27675 RepID=UPI0018A09B6C|nr:transmembrane protein 249 isoform X1 [Choloepus didactylus]
MLLHRAPPGQAPQKQQLLPVHAAAAQCLRARVLPGHALEGDGALRRLPPPGQLRPPEQGLRSWARPSRPSSPAGPRPRALRRSSHGLPVAPQVRNQETWAFPACGVVVGLWLMISSLPRRRLVLNHTRGIYHFSIQGRTVCQGPMHLVYVRLALSSDAYGKCFFQLVLCGHQLEPLVLVQLSERYEQMEFLGRHIARKLNINYFDCQAMSYWHVVRHWPLGSAFSPGIVQRRDHAYSKPSRSLTELDV